MRRGCGNRKSGGPLRHMEEKRLLLGIDSFFEILREHGMLGFESYHGGFVQI